MGDTRRMVEPEVLAGSTIRRFRALPAVTIPSFRIIVTQFAGAFSQIDCFRIL